MSAGLQAAQLLMPAEIGVPGGRRGVGCCRLKPLIHGKRQCAKPSDLRLVPAAARPSRLQDKIAKRNISLKERAAVYVTHLDLLYLLFCDLQLWQVRLREVPAGGTSSTQWAAWHKIGCTPAIDVEESARQRHDGKDCDRCKEVLKGMMQAMPGTQVMQGGAAGHKA
eukprot:GHRQ01028517.1.p1 GENE.GHRQ01028517.1~~GHRQ01028517.1.p1  ORF type:complete len:167 (+),score=13.16 GHRQ01028517.1:601-1101(+)